MTDSGPLRHQAPPPSETRRDPHSPAVVDDPAPQRDADTAIAVRVRECLAAGAIEEAREAFDTLVVRHQRRAVRIAYAYLRDAADADEVVQDAFVKAYTRLSTYRDAWPFEVWFTRVLINGCLDRRKTRARRDRWFVATDWLQPREVAPAAPSESPEAQTLSRERRAALASAIDQLDGRQRLVFVLCHLGGSSPKDISQLTGINESTVRVHLFRAAHKLRRLLGGA